MVGGKNNARQRRGEIRAGREKLRLRMVNMRTLKHEGPKWWEEEKEKTNNDVKSYYYYCYSVFHWYKKNQHTIGTSSKTIFSLSVCWILLDVYSISFRRVRKNNLTLTLKYCSPAHICMKITEILKNWTLWGLLGKTLLQLLVKQCFNTKIDESFAIWA